MANVFPARRGIETTRPITVWDSNGMPVGGTPTGGTWAIVMSGGTSPTLNYNAAASDVQAALAALAAVGTGNVAVSGGPIPTLFYVEYVFELGDVPQPTFINAFTGDVNGAVTAETTTGYDGISQGEIQQFTYAAAIPTVYVEKDGLAEAVSTNAAFSTGHSFAMVVTAAEMTADNYVLLLPVPATGYTASAVLMEITREPSNLDVLSIDTTTGRVDVSKIEGVDASNMLSTVGPTATQIASATVSAFGTGSGLTALATAANQTTIIGYVDCLPATWVVPVAVGGNVTATNAPSAADIKTAMEAAGGNLALILEDTGTTIPATLTTISGYVDCLPASWVVPATVGAAMTLAAGAIAETSFTMPSAPTGPATGALSKLDQIWRRFFKKATKTSTQIKTYADDGTTVVTTQTIADDATTQTSGAAS